VGALSVWALGCGAARFPRGRLGSARTFGCGDGSTFRWGALGAERACFPYRCGGAERTRFPFECLGAESTRFPFGRLGAEWARFPYRRLGAEWASLSASGRSAAAALFAFIGRGPALVEGQGDVEARADLRLRLAQADQPVEERASGRTAEAAKSLVACLGSAQLSAFPSGGTSSTSTSTCSSSGSPPPVRGLPQGPARSKDQRRPEAQAHTAKRLWAERPLGGSQGRSPKL